MGLSKKKMINMIITEFGGDPEALPTDATVDVELTTNQFETAFKRTFMWFTARKGFTVWRPIPFVEGQSDYKMKDDVANILDVIFEIPSDVSAFFTLGFFDVIPYGPQGLGGLNAGLSNYSSFAELLNFTANRKEVFSVNPDWSYQQQTKILNLTIRPGSATNLVLAQAKLNTFDVAWLDDWDQDLFYRYFLARSKIILGRVRSKYDSLPAAGGAVTLDGHTLLEEAKEEIEALDKEIFASQGPDTPVVG